jgi:NAD(P)-dependent dehydrogenase (short-subunit alcohol dehydrogenase family)
MTTPTGPQLRFDGKVAIITGAGRGLGREYALMLAARGAKVVVNDLGVAISDTDGSGQAPATNPADDVVAEIVAAGGDAVANHDTIATVEGGAAIVDTAVDAFGTVDVVVNNAGQVRMHPFGEFPDEHVATVIGTQLLGTLNVSRPAWRIMVERGGGRFVNVSSGAAYGGFNGTSVYSMAKAGVIGLTIAMATEGAEVGIAANVVAPYAKTRPGTGFGPIPWSEDLANWLHPSKVAPVVVWLAHESCEVTGECFAVGAGHVARVAFGVNDGFTDRDLTPVSVAAHALQLAAPTTSPVGGPNSPLMANMMGDFGS